MISAKRVLDVAVAVVALTALSPLLALVTILIRGSSAGGALIVQTRIGLNEIPFECLKFRTMAIGAPEVGTHEASPSWVTPIGRNLRRWKLDELPQLINVMRGDMSLVGPRPCLASQLELISARRQLGVFKVRPGITGLAQIAGIDMSTPRILAEADNAYVESHSMTGDLRILIATVRGKGTGDAIRRSGRPG